MRPRFSLWLGFAAVVVVLDQLTKQIVLAQLVPGESIPVTRFFNLVLLFNPGAAFSFLADHSGWQRWFFTGLAAAICLWLGRLMYQHQHERLQPFAFALIIGGAIGNAIDRLAYGAVVDFALFHVRIGEKIYNWYVFNLADAAIVVGVAALLYDSFRGGDAAKAP